jgi:hypothetical protein
MSEGLGWGQRGAPPDLVAEIILTAIREPPGLPGLGAPRGHSPSLLNGLLVESATYRSNWNSKKGSCACCSVAPTR